VLAGSGPVSRLRASELARLDLRNAELVVLSACRTVEARRGRADWVAGLGGAMLQAGAGGVVASDWSVDDLATRALMVDFHRTYRRLGDPARALREAQLRLLHAPDPSLRSPAAWAGFRYAGR
jgi:CHAT domain-containing protein